MELIVGCKLFFSAYFLTPYCRICFVQLFSGVTILIRFFCLFGIDEFYVHMTVHRNKFARKLSSNLCEIYQCRVYSE
jgi:hypothetical protein